MVKEEGAYEQDFLGHCSSQRHMVVDPVRLQTFEVGEDVTWTPRKTEVQSQP